MSLQALRDMKRGAPGGANKPRLNCDLVCVASVSVQVRQRQLKLQTRAKKKRKGRRRREENEPSFSPFPLPLLPFFAPVPAFSRTRAETLAAVAKLSYN